MNFPRAAGLRRVNTIVVVLSGPVERDDVPRLVHRVGRVLDEREGDLVVCDVGALDHPDADTIDLLCRLQLAARRLGRRVLLLDAGGELRELIAWTGLSEVMPCE